MKILGVDPGIHGGLAIVEINDGATPRLVEATDTPTAGIGAKERVDVLGLCTWIQNHQPDQAVIERGQAMPRQGASSGFGRACGSLEATILCCQIPLTIIEPAVWKRAYHLRGGGKESARQLAPLRRSAAASSVAPRTQQQH